MASIRKFVADERGNATIEAVIWVPTFVAVLLLVVDVSMIFNGQARLFRLVQDTNRALSVGRLQTTTQAEEKIKSSLAGTTSDPIVKTSITDGIITTTLSVPAKDLDIVGYFSALKAARVTVSSQHYVEY
jgi:Flp pilus assembly protein TadG